MRAGKPTHNPTKFDPIAYGQRIQLTETDDSPLCSDEDAKFIREVVGVFMYYARAIDITMATPLSKLSIGQARPTTRTLDAVMYFLQYAATYPDATLTYYPSDMRLVIYSDASYLSETNARSRAGGLHYLSSKVTQSPHPLTVLSKPSAQSSPPSSRLHLKPKQQLSSSTAKQEFPPASP